MLYFSLAIMTLVIIAVIYVFLVMPRVTDGADMDLQSTDYAMGGLWDKTYPPYSLEALSLAKDAGYGLAFAVRLNKGRVIVCEESGLPLSAILSMAEGHIPLLIELKSSPHQFVLCRQLCEQMDTYSGAFSVMSRDIYILEFFKKYRPRFARGLMLSKQSPFTHKHMWANVICRPDFFVTDGGMIREPAFLLATGIFKAKGFVGSVRTQKQYRICRDRGLLAIFEKIRP